MAPRREILGSMRQETAKPLLSKLRAGANHPALKDAELLAVVQVRESGYVPKGIELRSSITSRIFTARIPAGQLDQVLEDPGVLAVQPNEALQES